MGNDRDERNPPGGEGKRAKRAGGVGDGTKKRGRLVNAGPAKSLLFLWFHVKLSTTYNFLRGLELIIRLSIYSDLFFTHLSKSTARSESLTVIGWFLPV